MTNSVKAKNIGYIFKSIECKNISKTPITRIIPVGRFLEIIKTKTISMIKPKKWEDPFENLFLNGIFSIFGENATLEFHDSVYAQCWSLHTESDAMWRIYSPNKDGIKITTTPNKLLKSLKASTKEYQDIKCFIGEVSYHEEDELRKIFDRIDIFSSDGTGIARSLLVKRNAFSHEKEVRLIYSADREESAKDFYEFNIKPELLFDLLTFDPRMDDGMADTYSYIIKNLGLNIRTEKSTLYSKATRAKKIIET